MNVTFLYQFVACTIMKMHQEWHSITRHLRTRQNFAFACELNVRLFLSLVRIVSKFAILCDVNLLLSNLALCYSRVHTWLASFIRVFILFSNAKRFNGRV